MPLIFVRLTADFKLFEHFIIKEETKETNNNQQRRKAMKKFFMIAMMLMSIVTTASAQSQAEIKFDKLTQGLGTFSEKDAVQTTTFTFTNVGQAPLVINQVVASCGCTVPKYEKKPIAPGQQGTITVTYNGKGKFPGHFKKSITVRTNGKTEMTRLYIEGDMTE